MKSAFLATLLVFSFLNLLAQSPDASRSNISDTCYCQPSDTVSQKDIAEYERLCSMHANLAKEYSKKAKELARRSREYKANAAKWEEKAKVCMTDANTRLNNNPASEYGSNFTYSVSNNMQSRADEYEKYVQSYLQTASELREKSESYAKKAEVEEELSEYYKKMASLSR